MNLLNTFILALIAYLMAISTQAQSPDDIQTVAAVQTGPAIPNPLGTFGNVTDRTEYTRTILKSLPVDNKDALAIENRFGDVSVSVWDRNEFRVQIVITASSANAEQANKALNAVRIDERRNDNAYVFQTVIDKEYEAPQTTSKNVAGAATITRSTNGSSPDGQINWKITRQEGATSLRIDYKISLPRENALVIKNNFGNVIIPDFWAPLSIHSKVGDIIGGRLNNANTVIKASFGNVTLREVKSGSVDMSFGDLVINSGNVLSIQQTYGKLNIGEANKVDARTSYTDALIGAVRQSGKFRMNYAKQFRLERIGATAGQIDVEASYSTVALPVQSTPNCDFDVTVTHGGFTYPTLPNLQLLVQPAQPQMPVSAFVRPAPATKDVARPNRPRQYVGRVGTGEGPRIRVVSTYGDVRFNK